MGLECPEPLANLYTRSYFRATWVTTALDAGFWSAMHIRRKWLRDISSVIFSIYYMICAEQADEKVRKVRAVLTVDHLRVSWNKNLTPYISAFTRLTRPRFMRHKPRAIRIPRPPTSSYTEPVHAWLYFDGPLSALKKHTKLVLNIPGGGFVAMNPRTHDDALFAWAGKTGLPILSLDYKKAPEYPYPYALNECYDVYHTIVSSNGRCVGLSGDVRPEIVVSGDSAGGNLAAGLVLMILQSGSTETRRWLGEDELPPPAGLILIYPALDMNIGNWMTDEQMALIRDRKMRKTNRRVMRHKSDDFHRLAPSTPLPQDEEDESPDTHARGNSSKKSDLKPDNARPSDIQPTSTVITTTPAPSQPQVLKTRLATPSLLSYTSDRLLTPEMMRAMIILYIGPHNRPDFTTEYLLSPVIAPESLLAAFPKTYFLTGERDPLVDDTVIMAGRIRHAKAALHRDRAELGALGPRELRRGFVETDHVVVKLVEGISHGFAQFPGIFNEAWELIYMVGRWYEEAFEGQERKGREVDLDLASLRAAGRGRGRSGMGMGRHHFRSGTASSAEDERPLEMSVIKKASNTASYSEGNGNANGNGKANGTVKPTSIAIPPPPHHRTSTFHDDRIESSETILSPDAPYTPLARDHPLGKSHRRRQSSGRVSMVSFGSEDDLLGRRMRTLVGGLTRVYPDVK